MNLLHFLPNFSLSTVQIAGVLACFHMQIHLQSSAWHIAMETSADGGLDCRACGFGRGVDGEKNSVHSWNIVIN